MEKSKEEFNLDPCGPRNWDRYQFTATHTTRIPKDPTPRPKFNRPYFTYVLPKFHIKVKVKPPPISLYFIKVRNYVKMKIDRDLKLKIVFQNCLYLPSLESSSVSPTGETIGVDSSWEFGSGIKIWGKVRNGAENSGFVGMMTADLFYHRLAAFSGLAVCTPRFPRWWWNQRGS